MDISVQCYADGSMTEDFTEGFDIKTQLNAPGCKSMPQDMIIDRCNPAFFLYSVKVILKSTRFHTAVGSCQDITFRVSIKRFRKMN